MQMTESRLRSAGSFVASEHTLVIMTTEETLVSGETADQILGTWPEEPTEIAEDMIDKYGQPDEILSSKLLWRNTGPWKRTELYRDGVPHNFPKEHTDYLEQTIDYRAPPETYDELAEFDGSVYPNRTSGELSAKCDKEAMNFLAINLANEIIVGKRSVEEARNDYALTAMKFMMGASPDYTQEFQFELPAGDQRDPDEAIVTDQMKEEIETESEHPSDAAAKGE